MMHSGPNGPPPVDGGRYIDYGMAPHDYKHDPHLAAHYGIPPSHNPAYPAHHAAHHPLGSLKRSPESAGLMTGPASSDDDDEGSMHDIKPTLGQPEGGMSRGRGGSLKPQSEGGPPTGKKTKGRVKIKMEFIDNKLRRYTTFSKRKTGIMKKAYELSTLTGTQVMLLVASETGHVYTFATRKLQPMITSDAGKALIQTCLNSPDSGQPVNNANSDQRMSASGYEETELTYNAIADAAAAAAAAAAADEQQKVRQMMYNAPYPLFSSSATPNGAPPTPNHMPYNPAPSPSPSQGNVGVAHAYSPTATPFVSSHQHQPTR